MAHILIVEDEPLLLELLVMEFEDEGFMVTGARGAEEAIVTLKGETPPDVMMTDVRMPGMDGWQLGAVARQLRPGIPVFYTTGYCDGDAPAIDPSRLFLKPYRVMNVIASVVDSLPNRSRTR